MIRKPKLLATAAVVVIFFQLMVVRLGSAQEPGKAQGKENQGMVQMALNWYHNVVVLGHVNEAPKYMADDYIEHDPRVSGGRAGFITYYANASARPPEAKLWGAIAQGDYVVMVWNRADKDPDTGTPYNYTTYDVVRVKNGKIQEHWDNAKLNSPW